MPVARGEKTYIKKLQRKQVDLMQWWGHHRDPLFDSYNFPIMNEREREFWYQKKKHSFSRRCFAVYNLEDRFVGNISLRNIRWLKRTSELGIVFDPNYINKGYGTDSLKTFIKYYFETMKMKELKLKVALFNERAEKCYQKCGFHFKEIEYDYFEDQDFKIYRWDKLMDYQNYFKFENNILFCKYKSMYITREMAMKSDLVTNPATEG